MDAVPPSSQDHGVHPLRLLPSLLPSSFPYKFQFHLNFSFCFHKVIKIKAIFLGSASLCCGLECVPGLKSSLSWGSFWAFPFSLGLPPSASCCPMLRNICFIYWIQFYNCLQWEARAGTSYSIRVGSWNLKFGRNSEVFRIGQLQFNSIIWCISLLQILYSFMGLYKMITFYSLKEFKKYF